MFEFNFLDKRVQRTKSDLYNAFFELLRHRKYDHITIKDIVEVAGYSRGVFYKHYKKKEDLLNEIIEYLFREARKAQREPYKDLESIDVKKLINEPIYLLRHFKKFGFCYQLLLNENINGPFSLQLSQEMMSTYLNDFKMMLLDDYENSINGTLNKYYAYGLMGLIIEWIIEDFPKEPEDFSDELVRVFKYSLGKIQIK
ncbi:TetR/AcrR family transcriptional regulator [Lysinibacillus yapensis]|nr:TetR/AcrR family transcriptional regulator [Lysinibacillus yapensis]